MVALTHERVRKPISCTNNLKFYNEELTFLNTRPPIECATNMIGSYRSKYCLCDVPYDIQPTLPILRSVPLSSLPNFIANNKDLAKSDMPATLFGPDDEKCAL